jgi:(S)-2-hydroxy-acid oxidase
MNRLANQDELVFSIKDLQREGTKKLSKTVAEYYNEGSMDLLT